MRGLRATLLSSVVVLLGLGSVSCQKLQDMAKSRRQKISGQEETQQKDPILDGEVGEEPMANFEGGSMKAASTQFKCAPDSPPLVKYHEAGDEWFACQEGAWKKIAAYPRPKMVKKQEVMQPTAQLPQKPKPMRSTFHCRASSGNERSFLCSRH